MHPMNPAEYLIESSSQTAFAIVAIEDHGNITYYFHGRDIDSQCTASEIRDKIANEIGFTAPSCAEDVRKQHAFIVPKGWVNELYPAMVGEIQTNMIRECRTTIGTKLLQFPLEDVLFIRLVSKATADALAQHIKRHGKSIETLNEILHFINTHEKDHP